MMITTRNDINTMIDILIDILLLQQLLLIIIIIIIIMIVMMILMIVITIIMIIITRPLELLGAAGASAQLYEEFITLAETGLAQHTLNYLKIA